MGNFQAEGKPSIDPMVDPSESNKRFLSVKSFSRAIWAVQAPNFMLTVTERLKTSF
ncbi:hypothetical protein ACKFKG_07625 [Phormidesmis sp. 146-35]